MVTIIGSSTGNRRAEKKKREEEERKRKEEARKRLKSPEVFTDEKTGRLSGITLPGVLPESGPVTKRIETETGKELPLGNIPQPKTFLGLGPKEVTEIAQRDIAGRALPEGTAPVGTARAEAEAQERVAGLVPPERRELDPTLEPGEAIPIIGPLLIKIKKLAFDSIKDTVVGNKVIGDLGKEDLQPEELRTLALTEIERIEIERGLTKSEQFGSFVEAVPAAEFSKWIPGFGGAEKPSQNVATVLKSMRILKSRAIDVELKFQKGLLSAGAARDRLTSIENEIQKGESRMRLLIQDSPELKFNSDGVNFIELKTLEVKERLFDSRIAIESGVTGDPNDLDILIALQESVGGEDFDIPDGTS